MGNVCFIIFGLILFAILVGFFAYFAEMARRRRREALAALARSLGWRFDPSENTSHDERYKQFKVFRKGHSRYAYNTITGEMTIDGRTLPVRMGDYRYQITTNNGKSTSTTTYQFSYLIIELPFLGAQDLFVRHEGVFDKLAGFIGFDDIDFESAEFSKRFYVKSSDKRFAYYIMHPRMMEFLLASDPPIINLEDRCCCFSEDTKRWEPEEFRAMLAWSEAFFDHWPRHVTATFDRE